MYTYVPPSRSYPLPRISALQVITETEPRAELLCYSNSPYLFHTPQCKHRYVRATLSAWPTLSFPHHALSPFLCPCLCCCLADRFLILNSSRQFMFYQWLAVANCTVGPFYLKELTILEKEHRSHERIGSVF